MLLRTIKRHVCATVGDTASNDSILHEDYLTDYINWAINDIVKEIRHDAKQVDFFFAEATISTDTDGVSGEYPLPRDFGAFLETGGVRGNFASSREFGVELVPIKDWARNVAMATSDRGMATVIGKSPNQRIRFYPTPMDAGMTISLSYNRKPYKLTDDSDEITIFPDDDGWEEIIVLGAAVKAYRYHGGLPGEGPFSEYQRELSKKIMSLNADAPDDQTPVHIGEVEKAFINMRRR
jgi:hypothetical protein